MASLLRQRGVIVGERRTAARRDRRRFQSALARSAQTGTAADLGQAIDAGQKLLAALPADAPDRADILVGLGSMLRLRGGLSGSLADAEAAIEVDEQAVTVIGTGAPNRAQILFNLSTSLVLRYAATASAADLDQAITVNAQALAASRSDRPEYQMMAIHLFAVLRQRTACPDGDAAGLDIAVELPEVVLAAMPPDHLDRPMMLSDLGLGLRARGERTDNLDDVNRAVEAGEQAVGPEWADHPDRAKFLNNLGRTLQVRFNWTGVAADRERAVEVGGQAIAAAADPVFRATCRFNLSSAVRIGCEGTEEQDCLNRAVKLGEQAVTDMPEDHPFRSLALITLAKALLARYRRFGERADLDQAIDQGELALAAISPENADYAAILSNLGLARRARAELTSSRADLDRAIEVGELAVEAAQPGAKRAECLSNLGGALWFRYERDGEMTDLDQAIELTQQALDKTPPGHCRRAAFWSNLGAQLGTRSERKGSLADLDRAVEAGEQAIAATRRDSYEYARRLSNLGADLQARFERTGAPTDLDRAVELSEQAVAAIPAEHPERAAYLSTLGIARRAKFRRSGAPADLDRAVWAAERAVEAVAAGHPDRAGYLSNLSVALSSRFMRTGAAADLDLAIAAGREGAAIVAAPPRNRLQAARMSASCAVVAKKWDAAVAGYALAVELLPQVAPIGIGRSDQEYWLAELGGLAEQAAACCLRGDQTDTAVELWDHSRGILLGQALDIRTDLTGLGERHPQLAREFTQVRDELARLPAPVRAAAGEAGHQGQRRRALAGRLEQVITEIRSQPGFGGFLRPLSVDELGPPADDDGRVVLVNVSDIRSDALVLSSEGVLVVPLPDLTPAAVREQVRALMSALGEDGDRDSRDEDRIAAVLGWLWDALAGPVLDRLGLTAVLEAGAAGPRLWWCLSGLLALLPVHAAGRHETRFDEVPQTVLDRVVSSYTPTARALAHVRQAAGGTAGSAELLVVAMPHTQDAGDLPGAEQEAELLEKKFPGRVTVLPGARATFTSVTTALPGCRWAHFACHAASDLTEPSASRLLLSDYQSHPLTVLELNRLLLDGAELAFLSACATARTGTRLPDEAIHLASAFQLAGYRHVISTLWPIADCPAVRVAEVFYAGMDVTGADGAARALRDATLRRRGLVASKPSMWAAHIHNGA